MRVDVQMGQGQGHCMVNGPSPLQRIGLDTMLSFSLCLIDSPGGTTRRSLDYRPIGQIHGPCPYFSSFMFSLTMERTRVCSS